MNQTFELIMESDLAIIEDYLSHIFDDLPDYANLRQAMEYSLIAGGKRIRPVLTLETCRMCGGEREDALAFACAIEMIHTYSLIHDDLPAMDNSDIRRGKPANHVVFGQCSAILAGDGLLTAAFEVLTKAKVSPAQIVKAVSLLSHCAGPHGMVGGQALDIDGEQKLLSLEALETLQSLKTGALISAAAQLGCIAAGGDELMCLQVNEYAMNLGRAFQIRDDLLDLTSSQEDMGKPVLADAQRGKNTFATLLGKDACLALISTLTQNAIGSLSAFHATQFHRELALSLADRTS